MDWLTASGISLLPPCIMIEDHIASLVEIKIQHSKSGLYRMQIACVPLKRKISSRGPSACWSPGTLSRSKGGIGMDVVGLSEEVGGDLSFWMCSFLSCAYLCASSISCCQSPLSQVMGRRESRWYIQEESVRAIFSTLSHHICFLFSTREQKRERFLGRQDLQAKWRGFEHSPGLFSTPRNGLIAFSV